MKHFKFIITLVFICLAVGTATAQRRITPVNTAATTTQPVNENKDDTARINKKMRESMRHYHDSDGNIIYVDTITGREWRDSTELLKKKPMLYPLLHSTSVGVDLWNPLMRVFGQHYGLIGFSASVNLHNRYIPVFEIGLGQANNTPATGNFTYKSPMSIYFRLGANYNFLFNSNPDYQLYAGVRYGFSPFKFSLEDITIDAPVWDASASPTIPSQNATVGWFEIGLGVKVKIVGPVSAGWMLRYHSILHESKSSFGQPWYIPGYGTRSSSLTGSFSIFYTLGLNKKTVEKVTQ